MPLNPSRGFPTDFPVVGLLPDRLARFRGRGFPTDFPVVGYRDQSVAASGCRGFPTDFPVVGSVHGKMLFLL